MVLTSKQVKQLVKKLNSELKAQGFKHLQFIAIPNKENK